MMKILYKKLLEVIIRHDYYLESVRSVAIAEDDTTFAGQSLWPKDYDLRQDLEIVPTAECSRILRDLKIAFKPTAAGFTLYVRAVEREGVPNSFHSLVFIEPDTRLSFLIKVKNPSFVNFTNLRLTGRDSYLYYFSNQSGNLLDENNSDDLPAGVSFRFLSKPMLEHGSFSPGESQYQLGDLVVNPATTRMLEALRNIDTSGPNIHASETSYPDCSPPPGAAVDWQPLPVYDARYATVLDRLKRQSPSLTYTRDNDNPGESIVFTLLDIQGNAVELGNIPGTNRRQNQTAAPTDGSQPVFHRIDLSRIPEGWYTLLVSPVDTSPVRPFYWLPPVQYPDAFGVIELFPGDNPAGFDFLDHTSLPGEAILNPKTYEIRFRNRTTCWRYIQRDGSEPMSGADPIRPRRSLSRFYSGYQLPGIAIDLPDAGVDLIHPDPYDREQDLIENIFSEIYLNEQYKIN